jgi:hypothetical protein
MVILQRLPDFCAPLLPLRGRGDLRAIVHRHHIRHFLVDIQRLDARQIAERSLYFWQRNLPRIGAGQNRLGGAEDRRRDHRDRDSEYPFTRENEVGHGAKA